MEKNVNKILFALESKEEKLIFVFSALKAIETMLRVKENTILRNYYEALDLCVSDFKNSDMWKQIVSELTFSSAIMSLEVVITKSIRDNKLEHEEFQNLILEISCYSLPEYSEDKFFFALNKFKN